MPFKLDIMTATPNQLAEILTARILGGDIASGDKLLEAVLASDLGVSRNTLRETFRMLARDGLVEHIPHRGVFVKVLSPREVVELFAYRRFLELGSIKFFADCTADAQNALVVMSKVIDVALTAASVRDWNQVGVQNNEFHAALVGASGIPRLVDNVRLAMAHSRLAFMAVGTNENVHAPFLDRNQEILQKLRVGEFERAHESLASYLQESEARILGEMSIGG
ncbi:GntR family transcriptional regulator [Corynebacterium epidermidicanis]|uniref:Transcriptional regulator n=1 Tax=Corynebacterium epidermidicanis TaxID=1050174 RepID=A0A0G3GVA8_9CORY|nr:GntR family transcriptional regulator [Corynebacterium epidermidicanis]AKK02767.1 transcriptional regulator [Corynebacterium epidermidicanis]